MGLLEIIDYYYVELADPRMKNWFLMKSIWSPILIVLFYIIVIFKLAPEYMKNRPAYKFNTFIKCYNIFQVIANAILVKEFASCYQFHRAFECREVIYTMDPCATKIMYGSYVTMLLKIIDLIETVLFILRKKKSQVTILHVYHHISTVLIGMIFSRYFSVNMALLFPILNCSVHVIMYTYYFFSNFEGSIKQKILPFKRYLTIIQMVQFVILLFQLFFAFPKSCPLPKIPFGIMFLNMALNLGLFYNFYRKTYFNQKEKKK
ncbi:elongation of very long chain fatty acids protein 4-like [Leptopilina boulardi]|uniref:elongation of very long chain fatty acids protein 4-like n=1 Tax=Leptopilina boulardi TaxID=63433 RepID=UPI0021F6830E|nr:elongation of very long chain fatty acids protein 4-like [Leptopilina boulardi]